MLTTAELLNPTTWECPHCFVENGTHTDRCPMKHVTKAPAAPMVHMNGTGYRDLYEGYDAAYTAVGQAITALCKAAPNGRDYYPQPSGTMERAQDEHHARVTRLLGITAELEYILMKLSDQESARGNR